MQMNVPIHLESNHDSVKNCCATVNALKFSLFTIASHRIFAVEINVFGIK